MHISEITFTVNSHGSLKIPAATLREMGLSPGNHVRIAYLTHDGEENTFQEFLLSAGSLDESAEENPIQIPTALLVQADIPEDADLQIVCLKGALLICQDTSFDLAELHLISEYLKTADELLGRLPSEKADAINELRVLINDLERGVKGNGEF